MCSGLVWFGQLYLAGCDSWRAIPVRVKRVGYSQLDWLGAAGRLYPAGYIQPAISGLVYLVGYIWPVIDLVG